MPVVDNWTGSNGSAWNASIWEAILAQSSSTVDIQSNAGRMNSTGAAYTSCRARLIMSDTADVDYSVKMTFDSTNEAYAGISMRTGTTWGGDGENTWPLEGYTVEVDVNTGGLVLFSYSGGSRTSLGTASHSATAAAQWVRMQCTGTTIRCRWWLDGSSEPGTWDISVTNSTHTTGRISLTHFNGAAGTARSVSWDDLTNNVASTSANAGNAAGTGTAYGAKASISTSAGNAAGTGTAFGAKDTVAPTAGLASGAGAAFGATTTSSTTAGVASGTGTAYQPSTAGHVTAGLATGTGTAFDPTVSTSGATNANAGNAAGTGTANNPAASVSVSAGVAAGSGTANNPTVQTSGSTQAAAGCATGTGSAYGPTISTSINAGLGTGTGSALAAGASLQVTTGIASGTGTAYQPRINVSVLASCATGAGSAFQPSVSGGADLQPGPNPSKTRIRLADGVHQFDLHPGVHRFRLRDR